MAKKSKTNRKQKPNPRCNDSTLQRFNESIEICILAGGLSKRMGRDKSRLPLGSTTMLGLIRKTARATGLPVRIIRRDLVPKCGPLGGIYTALKTTKAAAVIFLACDMPMITAQLIEFVLQQASDTRPGKNASFRRAIFVRSRGCAGFPFVLPRGALEFAHQQIQNGDFSLRDLSKALRASILSLARPWSRQLCNLNTPQDWMTLRSKTAPITSTEPAPPIGEHSP